MSAQRSRKVGGHAEPSPAQAAASALEDYRTKRDFSRTREPRGSRAAKSPSSTGHLYVMHKHQARRLHFDLRLELDGVLKSWAVTKGPSLDTSQKRLSIRTEDHPLDYGSFEGTIPAGEYGAGTVMLWDRGKWTPQGDPHLGLERGELKFTLEGERLKGGFALVRLPARSKEKRENWLLVKERDGLARGLDPVREWTKSVATGRTFDEIAAAQGRAEPRERTDADVKKPRLRLKNDVLPMPRFRRPQLATLAAKPPSGENWLHEIKFDGYRIMAAMAAGKSKLYTRSSLDWTDRLSELPQAIAQLPARSALIDGEVVVIDEDGRTDFGRLQRALKTRDEPLHFYAFDLLELDGEDIAHLKLADRKARLAALLREAPQSLHYSDHLVGEGGKVLNECCRMGLEGIVSKRADEPYVSRRTRSWIKTKCTGRDEFVIGGWRPSAKKGRPFSSLLLGEFDKGELRFRGHVGTGFTGADFATIAGKLRQRACTVAPFANIPAAIARHAKWARPTLVAEVAYAERTKDGYLRQPRFIALREDKPANSVKASLPLKPETRAAMSQPRARLTHPQKVFFPAAGLTKADLAAYWRRVAEFALPHIQNRPLSLVRCPEGKRKDCFFQRHYARGMPAAIKPAPIADGGKIEQFLKVVDASGLEAAAQIGALELHIWGAHADSIEMPDRLVFDLDPGPDVTFAQVKEAARDFHALLDAAGLTSFALLTGGKGIHIVAPLAPALSWEELKTFAKGVAMRLAADDPARFTARMSKARREGKIYIDYLRNERGASAIAPYSPRANETASVAAPIGWDELSRIDRADAYTIATLPRRIVSLRRRDPWRLYFDIEQRLSRTALQMFAPSR